MKSIATGPLRLYSVSDHLASVVELFVNDAPDQTQAEAWAGARIDFVSLYGPLLTAVAATDVQKAQTVLREASAGNKPLHILRFCDSAKIRPFVVLDVRTLHYHFHIVCTFHQRY